MRITSVLYVCFAGVADRVRITSEPIGVAAQEYDLSWEVQSYSPIQEYKVVYRRGKVRCRAVRTVWRQCFEVDG